MYCEMMNGQHKFVTRNLFMSNVFAVNTIIYNYLPMSNKKSNKHFIMCTLIKIFHISSKKSSATDDLFTWHFFDLVISLAISSQAGLHNRRQRCVCRRRGITNLTFYIILSLQLVILLQQELRITTNTAVYRTHRYIWTAKKNWYEHSSNSI